MGKSCGTGRKGKSQFKIGSDWWKFRICNRENLVGNDVENCCGKMLRANLVGNVAGSCCGKILQEILVGKSCGKILWDREEGKKPN